MEEERQLEPLVIIEEGDLEEGVTEREPVHRVEVTIQINSGLSTLQMEDGQTEADKGEKAMPSETNIPKKQTEQMTESRQTGAYDVEMDEEIHKSVGFEEMKNTDDGQNRVDENVDKCGQTGVLHEAPGEVTATQTSLSVEINALVSSDQAETESSQSAQQAHLFTPDFPEALYDLLCALQGEGRRLNDQRCSFTLKQGVARRRCHSEPNTTKPAPRVTFSSMTSLQKEEFFEFLAATQARRLDDQRAELQKSPAPKPKSKSLRGSIKHLSIVKKPPATPSPPPAPLPVPKEDLYNMILTTQAQGRLEDQRSSAPGPMDDEDFFSLLLRVQGGRMEEQRTELPCILQT